MDNSRQKIKLYNTLTRKVEAFNPFNPELVKIYTCGPTVYSEPHVGNFSAYVYWDLLIRTLIKSGYGVRRVINLTDVGHLTSDADDGEDKMEKGARKSGETVWQVAAKYISAFQRDFRELNLVPPEIWARATDYIDQDEALVDILTEKGYTYETTDGIYFDTSKFPEYADFARLDLDNLKAGARVEFSSEKKHPSDFAVWKFIQPSEQHAMRWDYLGRPGYPGWHLECSTIIHEELGETIDIHCGGIDHIPVHHTNEIAQSEAAFEKKLAKYWLHCNFLTIDKQKISKSLGNIWTLDDLARKGYSPMDFKMWVLQGHYQSARDFNLENLEAARIRRLNWRRRISYYYQKNSEPTTEVQKKSDEVFSKVHKAVNDDLNSSMAFAIIDSSYPITFKTWQQIDGLFGLNLIKDSPDINDIQRQILEERHHAKLKKDYIRADELRETLREQNIAVMDIDKRNVADLDGYTKDNTGYLWTYAK